jgi:hypothetical protein
MAAAIAAVSQQLDFNMDAGKVQGLSQRISQLEGELARSALTELASRGMLQALIWKEEQRLHADKEDLSQHRILMRYYFDSREPVEGRPDPVISPEQVVMEDEERQASYCIQSLEGEIAQLKGILEEQQVEQARKRQELSSVKQALAQAEAKAYAAVRQVLAPR